MIHVFVDTNVLIDYLGRRRAFFAPARKLLTFAYQDVYDLWMSVSQSTDIFYILTEGGKPSRCAQVKEAMCALLETVHVVASTEEDVERALASDIADFEDALILSSAMSVGADVIVTRDEGLANGIIPTRTPEEFFSWLKEKHRIGYAEMQLIDGTWQRTL